MFLILVWIDISV